ncbi:caspase family protein [uncultured Erythrobacter sp.]|uniref:caspase family protein n=1 Tax=uncultured Erythrobacter sp. TaxID=263913 RepID=UPI0026347B33|nr:caspase family protein [uncultured Erythrobacter sp.]
MMRAVRVWAVFAALLLALPSAVSAQKVALVIANSDYEHTSQLANPSGDAALVAGALREAGFDTVEIAENLARGEFMERLRAFRDLADGADAALVYYAGHGVESDGRNWLVPTDAALQAERDMPFEAVELERILDTLYGASLRIVVLDACRNNPFANRWQGENRDVARGLAPFETDDMLVIYAAAPGAFAFDGADGNSPFALALARRIVQPGLPVQMLGGMVRDDVLAATDGDQRPFISASMTGRPLFLVDGPDTQLAWLTSLYAEGGETAGDAPALVDYSEMVASLDTTRSVAAEDSASLDEHVWLETLKLDNVEAYRAYLAEFPQGAYARFAEANIAQLLDPTATGGEINSETPWIISLGAALPDRYAVDLGASMPIDGVWRISTNDRRLRIERGRAFAVDGWNHALLFRVEPEQVTMVDIRRDEPGLYLGRDILLNGDARMSLRADGNLDVRVGTFPFPVHFVLIREALDDPQALSAEMPD